MNPVAIATGAPGPAGPASADLPALPILGVMAVLVAGLVLVLAARWISSRAQSSARVIDAQVFEDPLVAALKSSSRGGRHDRPSWNTVDPRTPVESGGPIWVRRLDPHDHPNPPDPEPGNDRPG